MTGYIFKKKVKGHTYYYAGESKRFGKTTRRIWEMYLGSFDKIVEKMKEEILLPDETFSTPYGLYSAFVEIAKEINFVNTIDKIYPKRNQGLAIGEYFLLGILARLMKPKTKSLIKEWYDKKNIYKIYPVDSEYLTGQNYWNNIESIDVEKLNDIHTLLIQNIRKIYDNKTNYIYFDPSNFHTFIQTISDSSTIPKNGNSKKKRYDLRQVNLALSVTKEDGFPIYEKTYAGNINDVTFLKENLDNILEHIKINFKNENVVIVFDKGNNSEKVFEILSDEKYSSIDFIGSIRPSTQQNIFNIPIDELDDSFETDSGNTVYFKPVSVKVYGKKYRAALTFDENTYRKRNYKFNENMENELEEVNEFIELKLNIKKWRKKENVEQKLKNFIGKKDIKNIMNFNVMGEYSNLMVSPYCVIKEFEKVERNWGKNLVFTSLEKEDLVDVIKGYRSKNDIETCYKMLNNNYLISIQPINHWTDKMIIVHNAICVLGLLMVQIIRRKLKDVGIKMSIEEVFERLSDVPLVKLHYKNHKTIYKIGTMDKITLRVAKVLNVKLKID